MSRFIAPEPIHFAEAIPIAVLGLIVNIGSVFLLSGGDNHLHGHGHHHNMRAAIVHVTIEVIGADRAAF